MLGLGFFCSISTHFKISVGDAFRYSILERKKSSVPDLLMVLELTSSEYSVDIVLSLELRRGPFGQAIMPDKIKKSYYASAFTKEVRKIYPSKKGSKRRKNSFVSRKDNTNIKKETR
jgi:hypothetical protein